MSSIFLTLDGKLSAKHPVHDIICREDGAVFSNGRWTFGGKYTKKYLGIGYKNKSYYIHRLIAEAFLPNPLKKIFSRPYKQKQYGQFVNQFKVGHSKRTTRKF